MADTALLYFNLGKIDTIDIDATISETHSSDVEITDHSVENGADISDHARIKPYALTLECCISGTPVGRAQEKRIADSQGVAFQTDTLQNDPSLKDGFAKQTYARIEALKNEARIITVVTRLKTYDDLMIQNLSVPVDSRTGNALRFSMTFKQIRVVNNKYTTQVIANTNTTQGKKKKSLGDKPTSALTEGSSSEAKAGAPIEKLPKSLTVSLFGL